MMTLLSYALCATGLVRTENQDNLYVNGIYRSDISDNSVFRHSGKTSKNGLYAIADGMGGEKHGELASLITVQTMSAVKSSGGCLSMVQYLIDRNKDICDIMSTQGGIRIGSTFAGICINGKNAHIVNIGDSRVYLFRGSTLSLLSRDHTSVQQMVDMGMISKEEARQHSMRHQLTQHLGIYPAEMIIEPYTYSIKIEHSDVFLRKTVLMTGKSAAIP